MPGPERICYTVTATIADPTVLRDYLDWLQSGHVNQVVGAGAEAGMIVLLDPERPGAPEATPAARVVTQYIFPSREAFQHYERDHAPALRADGLARFGAQTGKDVTFDRTVGTILSPI